MVTRVYEVRDAVHGFVAFDDDERRIIDSPPFQRLRHIHQLALTYKVYPGATHKRFEHCLGVMHLAGRVYDVITRPDKIDDSVRGYIPERTERAHSYWRTVVRMAALCHDMGHLPFSHAAEDLLPKGVDHEQITWDIVNSDTMRAVFTSIEVPVDPVHVAKIAIGPRKAQKLKLGVGFNSWEAILSDIIVGDAFGVDRMDYLLRDSLHAGVQYGRFDAERLIATLRVVPDVRRDEDEPVESAPPALGCERGGLLSAEQLLLARYFMFSQVYYHATRLAYNEHLRAFVLGWLNGPFPSDVNEHLARDDNDVLVAIKQAAATPGAAGHDPARRILNRDHYKIAYQRREQDTSTDVEDLAKAAAKQFKGLAAYGEPPSKKDPPDFPVYDKVNRETRSARGLSDVLNKLPESPDEYVLADAKICREVKRWLETNRDQILQDATEARLREARGEEGK
jgi:HD superfamily phosphohydrolase